MFSSSNTSLKWLTEAQIVADVDKAVRHSCLLSTAIDGNQKVEDGINSLLFVYKMSHCKVSDNYELRLSDAESKNYFQTVCSSWVT